MHTRRWGIAGAAAVVLLGVGGTALEAERKRIEHVRLSAQMYAADQDRRQREYEASVLTRRKADCRRELQDWAKYVAERQRNNNMPIRIDIIAERANEREQCEGILAGKAVTGTSDPKQARPAD